jgi:hypothetical protein
VAFFFIGFQHCSVTVSMIENLAPSEQSQITTLCIIHAFQLVRKRWMSDWTLTAFPTESSSGDKKGDDHGIEISLEANLCT